MITTNLPSVINTSGFELEIDSNEPLYYAECRIDDNYVPCDEIDFDALDDGGTHYFEIFGEDRAGNNDGFGAEFAVQIGASVAAFTNVPPKFKQTNSYSTFSFTSDPGATFECSVNEGSFKPCVSPFVVNEPEQESGYEFRVRATNNGVTQLVATRYHWSISAKPFDLHFDERPEQVTTSSDAYFRVHWDDEHGKEEFGELTLECALDDAPLAPCSTDVEFEALSAGEHTFTARLTSDLGGSETETYDWVVTEEPGVTISSTPDEYAAYSDATFYAWAYNGASSFDCKLDSGNWESCDVTGGGKHYSSLGEGSHTFSVRVAGTADPAPAGASDSFTWSIDSTPPSASVAAPAGGVTTDSYHLPITFNEPIKNAICTIDDADDENSWFVCRDGAELSGLSLGAHTITVRSWDFAHNESNLETFAFTRTLPATTPAQPTPPATPEPVKPQILKLKKPKGSSFRVPYTCADDVCKLKVTISLGDRKLSFKTKRVKKGTGVYKFKLAPHRVNWLAHKGDQQATVTVKISGASGSSSKTFKF